jgi:transcriptional regulator with XRE-family HTH domain
LILCTSSDVANRIKEYSKSKGYLVKDVLTECGLNKNALSIMLSRGSWIRADNLIKIADYLDCSVDYLLGRTDNPNSHKEKFL